MDVRNDLACIWCGSIGRERQIARFVIGKTLAANRSIRQLAQTDVSIYCADAGGAFARVLGLSPRAELSTFIPSVVLGQSLAPRTTNQDLQCLTYESAVFDAVITADVLEHVRDDMRAFVEIRRVLKPGGWHVFTVPYHTYRETTTRIDSSGPADVHLLPPEYHRDRLKNQVLTYRSYGHDLIARLSALGFRTELHPSYYDDRRIGVFESFVFASMKL